MFEKYLMVYLISSDPPLKKGDFDFIFPLIKAHKGWYFTKYLHCRDGKNWGTKKDSGPERKTVKIMYDQ